MCRIDEFWNIHETFPHFFSKQAKLRQPHRAETADFRFQISNFEIRQIAFLMTCRPHKTYFMFVAEFILGWPFGQSVVVILLLVPSLPIGLTGGPASS